MSDPYKRANQNDPILAETWNEMQLDIRNHILKHTHTGGVNEGTVLTGDSIDKRSTLQVEKVAAASTLSVRDIDVGAKLQALTDDKLSITGGSIRGALKIDGALTIAGDATVESSLTINTRLSVADVLSVTGSINAGKDLSVAGALSITKEATMKGALRVSGELKAEKTLSVTGEASFGGAVSLAKGATIRIASDSPTGSNYAVAAPDAAVRMVWGFVDSDSKIVSGYGFTVTKETKGFRVKFSNKFGCRPCVVVTQHWNGSVLDNAVVYEINAENCLIVTGDGQGNASYRHFSFVAIGT
jgi:cytoskeletal protein CcmA (bactofilin family)